MYGEGRHQYSRHGARREESFSLQVVSRIAILVDSRRDDVSLSLSRPQERWL